MTDNSEFDLRRRLREARARPWLTNSVVRRRSTTETSAGQTKSLDEPKPSVSTIVTAVPASCPPRPTSGTSEKQKTKPEKAPNAVAKAKALARSAGSKIPVWVGLSCAFSRCSLQPDGVETKDRPAAHPTVTKDTPASRLPVRVWRSIASCRPALPQVRRRNTPNAHAGALKDKGAGKNILRKGITTITLQIPGFKSKGLVREGVKPRPILKHRATHLDGAESSPLLSIGQGVKSEPKKKVMWSEKLITQYIPKGGETPLAWECKGCKRDDCNCARAIADRNSMDLSFHGWLRNQLALGYDNINYPVRSAKVVKGELLFELLTLESPPE
ncbi:hypothetical protein LTR84_001020 [Exophiala bonariae]|uniref:Uncharacterized protein n=1 Tax=Exophiala bonariae TaxID=1690606 RepID=A0AAV9NSB3_9EURO|nr:hypothetical protein LTR84_001020 [Exophiala bonariae]